MPIRREVARFVGPVTLIDGTGREHEVHGFLHAYRSIRLVEGREVDGAPGWTGTLRGQLPWATLAGDTVTLRLVDGNEGQALVTESHDSWHAIIHGRGPSPFRNDHLYVPAPRIRA
jgi:hypothetical protein